LAELLHPAATIGIDLSQPFVQRAANANEALRFEQHDVTVMPLPGAPADLLFDRYLLAHLPAPEAVARAWATQLRGAGARLLLEEIETIDTDIPVFRRYLDIVVAMARFHRTELLVGPTLPTVIPADDTDPVALVVNRTATITPAPATVGRMFSMNLSVWRNDPYAVETCEPAMLDALAVELDDVVTASGAPGSIVWTHRQVAFERRSSS
jgi:hypothetical protein